MVVDAVVEPETPLMVTVKPPVVAVLLALNVITLEPVVGLVPKAAVTPLGKPEADSVTAPVKPPVSVTVIVSVVLEPCVTEADEDDGASVKPAVPVPVVNARVAECVIEPSVPTSDMFVVPAGVLVCEKKFTVTVPLEFNDEGAKLAETPEGKPLALSDTLPVNPPTKVTVIVAVGLVFGGTESAVGETAIVKFGSAVTFKVNVVVSVVEPLVPVIVTVAAPTVAVFDAVKVSVLPAEPVTDDGLNDAVTPEGNPLMDRATVPLKPLMAETVTLSVAEVPCSTEAPLDAMAKPGAVVDGSTGKAFCTSMVK